MKQGLLIAIEAPTRQLAETQSKLLAKRLAAEGQIVVVYNFPDNKSRASYFATTDKLREYSSDKRILEHYRALFYSFERYDKQSDINRQLMRSAIVIVTGYTASTMSTLAPEIDDEAQRRGFYLWLDNFEENGLKITRPDLGILLGNSTAKQLGKTKTLSEIKQLFPKNYHFIELESDSGEPLGIAHTNLKIWEKVRPLVTPNVPAFNSSQVEIDIPVIGKKAPPELLPLINKCSQLLKKASESSTHTEKQVRQLGYIETLKNYLTPLACLPIAYGAELADELQPDQESQKNIARKNVGQIFPSCKLVSVFPNNELAVVEEAIFETVAIDLAKTQQQLNYEQQVRVYFKQLNSTKKEKLLPQYRFEFVTSITAYIKFLSLNIGNFVVAQKMSPYTGYIEPLQVKNNNLLQPLYEKCFKKSETVYRSLQISGQGYLALLGGYSVLWRATLTAPELKLLGWHSADFEIYSDLVSSVAEKHPLAGRWLKEEPIS